MQSRRFKLGLAVAAAGALAIAVAAVAAAHGGGGGIHEKLTGYEEVPALSTPGNGQFRASIKKSAKEIDYRLSFDDTETDVTQAHIHFENATNNGPIVVFFCSNLGNGPAGTQACPATGGTITGTIKPENVLTAGTSGIAAGEFDELVRAIRAGATYVNVHTTGRPGGEVRAQLNGHGHHFGFGHDKKARKK